MLLNVEGNWEYFLSFVAHCNVFEEPEQKVPMKNNNKTKKEDEMDDTSTSTSTTTVQSSCLEDPDSNHTSNNNNNNDDACLWLKLRDGCYFVYGGDAVDKGPGDIRLCRTLVSLKQRYPDRVVLLVGNRDLNKLRFTAELSQQDMERSIDEIPPPHWDPMAPTLRQHLERVAGAAAAAAASSSVDTKSVSGDTSNTTTTTTTTTTTVSTGLERFNTRVERLKYMLLHTLGCPETFEFRRQELALMRVDPLLSSSSSNNSLVVITDDDVLDSFLHEVEHPNGSLRQYLEHANVVAVIGNTLFAHGAVDVNTARFVPQLDSRFENPTSQPPPGQMCDTVEEWTTALNGYLRHGLDDYVKRPYWNEPHRMTRGGESLMALQNRPAMWGRSIISNCYGDGGVITTDAAAQHREDPHRILQSQTNPLVFEKVCSDPMDPTVADWLLQNGIQRVVVGHKPTGDCPAVLSSRYTGVEIVSADTSYSNNGNVHAKYSPRGQALAVMEIVGPTASHNHLEVSGTFADGVEYHSEFSTLHQLPTTSTMTTTALLSSSSYSSVAELERNDGYYLGTRLPDESGWWIKAATKTHYKLCKGSGRTVEDKMVPKTDIWEQIEQYESKN
jgi:hypothetical protein